MIETEWGRGMKSLIEQLYRGELCPDEKIASGDANFQQLSQKLSQTMEHWKKRHTEADWLELEAMLELYAERQGMELASAFSYGFRLGAGIMVEVLTGKDNIAGKLSAFPDSTTL